MEQDDLALYPTTAQKLNVNEKIYNPTLPADETRNDLEPRYEVFLREFLDYCKEQKYDNLLFVRFPHIVKKETYKRFTRGNAAFDIISEYGFNYINFERDENVMTYTADDYYNYDHLNIIFTVRSSLRITSARSSQRNIRFPKLFSTRKTRSSGTSRLISGTSSMTIPSTALSRTPKTKK